MSLRGRGVVVAAVVGISTVAFVIGPAHAAARAPRHVVDGRIGDWVGSGSGVAGSVQYDRGEFIHQDYVYDDAGATAPLQRPPQRGTFDGRTTGTFRYPTDVGRFADNAADLLELRLATDADHLFGLVRLNTLRASDTTVAALALDLDADGADSAGVWPRSAGLATPGADVVVTVWGTGGEITDLATGTSTPITVAADPADDHNAIEFAVDRSVLRGSSWRAWAATGLWDGHGWTAVGRDAPTMWSPGHGDPAMPRAFNVAFRGLETGALYEDRQAAALAAGDITGFAATVDVAALDARARRPYELPVGEFVEVVVEQSVTIPPLHEGTTHTDGVPGRNPGLGGQLAQTFQFYGRHQPYTLRIPTDWDGSRPWPLLFTLHGLGGTHAGWITGESFSDQVLEAPGHDSLVLVAPLARGSSFYSDYGEVDALEVLADAEARVGTDPDRRYLVGYSMGGYGTYRFATTRPDLWASAAIFAGYTGEYLGDLGFEYTGPDPLGFDGRIGELTGLGGGRAGQAQTGNPMALLANIREIPLLHAVPTNDEIVPTIGQLGARDRLDDLDYRHRFDLYPGYEHLSFAVFGNWAGIRDWFGDRTRDVRPRRVTYGFSPSWADPTLDLGLVHDRAYWVSGLVRRAGNDDPLLDTQTYGWIDAESHALPGRAVTVEPVWGVGLERHPHVQVGDSWVEGAPLPGENRLTLDLRNVSAAVIDTAAAGLARDGLVIELTTDGPATIVLTGSWAGRRPSTSSGSVRAGRRGLVIEASGPGSVSVTTPTRGHRPAGA